MTMHNSANASPYIYSEPQFRVYGDQGLLMEFGGAISQEVHEVVRSVSHMLEQQKLRGVIEFLPSYRSVAVYYDPLVTSFSELQSSLLQLYLQREAIELPPARVVELPVCYGGDLGPDIEFVASHNNISIEEVIALHSAPDYLIYMIGFTPGFPFLGGLTEKLHTPRLESPRKRVVAGSVGIANDQTGVYPIESPGGWQLIGRVPIPLFDPKREDPFLLKGGDLLRFMPITETEYFSLSI